MNEAIDALRDRVPMLPDRLALVNDRREELLAAGFRLVDEVGGRLKPIFAFDRAMQPVCFWCSGRLDGPKDHSMCAVDYYEALVAAAARRRRAAVVGRRRVVVVSR